MRLKAYVRRVVWRLRCRKCGKRATVYSDSLGIYDSGWYLKDTEECPTCAKKAGHVFKLKPYDPKYTGLKNKGV
jgi:hypothetical protein